MRKEEGEVGERQKVKEGGRGKGREMDREGEKERGKRVNTVVQ